MDHIDRGIGGIFEVIGGVEKQSVDHVGYVGGSAVKGFGVKRRSCLGHVEEVGYGSLIDL